MQNPGKTQNRVFRIQSIDEIKLNQIAMGYNWEDFKNLPISNWLNGLQYLQNLINGKHVFLVWGYGVEVENRSNLYLLVHCDGRKSEDYLMNYFLYAVEHAIWSPIGIDLQLFEQHRELFDAIQDAGVLGFHYSQARLRKGYKAARALIPIH